MLVGVGNDAITVRLRGDLCAESVDVEGFALDVSGDRIKRLALLDRTPCNGVLKGSLGRELSTNRGPLTRIGIGMGIAAERPAKAIARATKMRGEYMFRTMHVWYCQSDDETVQPFERSRSGLDADTNGICNREVSAAFRAKNWRIVLTGKDKRESEGTPRLAVVMEAISKEEKRRLPRLHRLMEQSPGCNMVTTTRLPIAFRRESPINAVRVKILI